MHPLALDRLRFAQAWRSAQEQDGRVYGAQLVAAAPSEWRAMLASDGRFRSYGALSFLTDYVHSSLEEQPTFARELAAVLTKFVDAVAVPETLFATSLRGRAWKEYANSLRVTGDMKRALTAALKAVEILDKNPGLASERAAAELAKAQILQELGESDDAIAIARRCAQVFRDHSESEYVGYARMTEAWVLFTRKQFREAMMIFSDEVSDAEPSGNGLALARALQATGECARELGDIAAARAFYGRALENFQMFNVATEIPRVRWAYALALADEGRAHEAISELFIVRAEYLKFGMIRDATLAALDVVRIKSEIEEDVAYAAAELIETFAQAGIAQNALEALAYLREQAERGTVSEGVLRRVTSYFHELRLRPAALFLPLPEEKR